MGGLSLGDPWGGLSLRDPWGGPEFATARSRLPCFQRESGQHGFKLASQIEAKSKKKAMQESIEKVMHLGIAFWKDFGGFLKGRWRHVGTNIM